MRDLLYFSGRRAYVASDGMHPNSLNDCLWGAMRVRLDIFLRFLAGPKPVAVSLVLRDHLRHLAGQCKASESWIG